MKNLFKILLGLFLVVSAISCSKDDGTPVVVSENQDVVFDITNFVPQVAGKNVFVTGKENDEVLPVPVCSDAEASYVEILIGETPYTLQLVTLNDKTETEVLKLAPGDYDLKSFIVYDANGNPIWASPMMGSYYQNLWTLKGVNDLTFTVDKFEKRRIPLDVLCYKPFQYEEFGFAWFAYAKIEIHTVCFFGDICTKFYEEFHAEGSPYYGQKYDGYDFPAMFSIVVKNGDNVVNDQTINGNELWQGVGAPLCIEYPDQVGVAETFTFDIWLTMPDGSGKVIYTGTFDDTANSAAGNADGFGGSDGIFDFVVGNCSYDGNDANMELPAYIPLPKSADMLTSWGAQGFDIYEFYMTFSNFDPAPVPGVLEEQTYRALCGEEDVSIYVPGQYRVDFYSSLELATIPSEYTALPWGSLNYIANNYDAYTMVETQQAIWYLLNPSGTTYGVNNQLAMDAAANPNFVPTVGDFAVVLVDPFREVDGQRISYQLLIVRVDP